MAKTSKKRQNIHPGEVLHEEFLVPLGISQYCLAGVLKQIHLFEPMAA